MSVSRIGIIGAGVAGLACAIDLAAAGLEVQLFERAASPGGKLRAVEVDGLAIDAGPTVFTLRDVFEGLFADAGARLERHLQLRPATLLARHVWSSAAGRAHLAGDAPFSGAGGAGVGTSRAAILDLYADRERSADAIGVFAGAREAQGFRRFCADARRVHRILDETFMRRSRPSLLGLCARVDSLASLWDIRPFVSLWRALGGYFRDPRLRQLFGRYATYCGSSPMLAPATLMLVADVEQSGVWYVEGGMRRLAEALAALARERGARLHLSTGIERIVTHRGRVAALRTVQGEDVPVDAVVCNADTQALASGCFGREVAHAVAAIPRARRSLSALTLNLCARTAGLELAHHTVFFSDDYRAEFRDVLEHRRLSRNPTIYVCAQDRADTQLTRPGRERLLCLVNAPADGDERFNDPQELDACQESIWATLEAHGLRLERGAVVRTTPADFHRMFPATGGALYGPASHGWQASFKRPGSRSRVPGLYLAGGSAHPGPGVPMAALSGRLAAAAILADCASTVRYPTAATSGGISTP